MLCVLPSMRRSEPRPCRDCCVHAMAPGVCGCGLRCAIDWCCCEAELRESLSRGGVDTLELATDDDLVDAVLRFAEMRRQRSRLAAGGGLASHLAFSPAASQAAPVAGGRA